MANNYYDMINDFLRWIGTTDGQEYINTNHSRIWQVLYDEGFNDTHSNLDAILLPRRFQEILHLLLRMALQSRVFHPGMNHDDDGSSLESEHSAYDRALQENPLAYVARQVQLYQDRLREQARLQAQIERIAQAARNQVAFEKANAIVPVLRLQAPPSEDDAPEPNAGLVEGDIPVVIEAAGVTGADMEHEAATSNKDEDPDVEAYVAGNDAPGADNVAESTDMAYVAGNPEDSQIDQVE